MDFDAFFIRRIAFFCSLTGLILLMISSNFFQEKLINLNEINENQLNEIVLIQGIVSDKKINFSGHLLFLINQEKNKMQVIAFNPSKELLELIQNEKKIKFTAKINEYNNEMQLILIKLKEK
jgi:uncharacterized membrane protein